MQRSGLIGAIVLGLLLVACADGGATRPESTSTIPETIAPTSIPSSPSSSSPSSTSSTSSTAPPETAPGSVLVVGDWGAGTDETEEIAAAMEAYAADHEVDAILTTGDNLYTNNYERALEPFDWVDASSIPWWVSWGNHDSESDGRIEAVNEAFDSPPHWTTIQWGLTAIVILDTNQISNPEQIDYLKTEMERIAKPTILVFHHPPLSCGGHEDTEAVWDEWSPLFDNDVVLVLNGHSHNYQRFEEGGIQYVVTGGGGKSTYELEDCPAGHPAMIAGAADYNFVTLSQQADRLELTALTSRGRVIDEISLPLP